MLHADGDALLHGYRTCDGVDGRGWWPLTVPAYKEVAATIVWWLTLSIHSVECPGWVNLSPSGRPTNVGS